MNISLKQFEEIGFWNMECVKISEAQQLSKLNEGSDSSNRLKPAVSSEQRL